MAVDIEFLKTLPRFRGLGDTELLGLARCMREVDDVPAGKILFEKGEPATGAYIVEIGQLDVLVPLKDGTGRLIAQLGPGTMVGELCLIEDAPRALRVRASRPSRLIFVDRQLFESLRRQGHSGAYKLLRSLALTVCDRLRNTTLQIEQKWQGVTHTTTEMEVVRFEDRGKVATPPPVRPASAWERLKSLWGGPT